MLSIKSVEVFSERPGTPGVRNQIEPGRETVPSFREVFETAQDREHRTDSSAYDKRLTKSEETHRSTEPRPEPAAGRSDSDPAVDKEPVRGRQESRASDSAKDRGPVKGREESKDSDSTVDMGSGKDDKESKESEDRPVAELHPSDVSVLVLPLVPDNSVQLKPLIHRASSEKSDSSPQAEKLKVQVENDGVFETTTVAPLPPVSAKGWEVPCNTVAAASSENLSPSPNATSVLSAAAPVSDKTAPADDPSSPAEALAAAPEAASAKALADDTVHVDPAVTAEISPFGRPPAPWRAQHQAQAHEKKFSLEVENDLGPDKSTEESALFQSNRLPKAGEPLGEPPVVLPKNTEVEFNNTSGGADTNARQGNPHHGDPSKASYDRLVDFMSSVPQQATVEQHNAPLKANTGLGSPVQDPPMGSVAAHKPAAELSTPEVHPASLGEAKSTLVGSANPSETAEARSGNLSRAERFDLVQEIVQKMKVMLRNSDSEVKITLKPEYLGELRLQATIRENAVVASILTQSAEVKDYLEKNLYLLQSALQGQGLRLDKLEVTTGGNFSADLSGGSASASNSNKDHPHAASHGAAFSLDIHQNDPLPESSDIASVDAPARRVNLTA